MGNDNNVVKNSPFEGTKLAEIKGEKSQKVAQTTQDNSIEHLSQPNIQGNKNNVIINNYLDDYLSNNNEQFQILRIARDLYPEMNEQNKEKYQKLVIEWLEKAMANLVLEQQEQLLKKQKKYKVKNIKQKLFSLWFSNDKKTGKK